jgi:hypothetical protein
MLFKITKFTEARPLEELTVAQLVNIYISHFLCKLSSLFSVRSHVSSPHNIRIFILLPLTQQPHSALSRLPVEVSTSHTHTKSDTPKTVGPIWTRNPSLAKPLRQNISIPKRQTSLTPAGIKPATQASKRPKSYALDSAAIYCNVPKNSSKILHELV